MEGARKLPKHFRVPIANAKATLASHPIGGVEWEDYGSHKALTSTYTKANVVLCSAVYTHSSVNLYDEFTHTCHRTSGHLDTYIPHVRTRTCGRMHYKHAYLCRVCNHNPTHWLIYTMHHRVHAYNSYTSTSPYVKWFWLTRALDSKSRRIPRCRIVDECILRHRKLDTAM